MGSPIPLGDAVLVYLERTFLPQEPLPPGVVPRAYGVAPASATDDDQVVAGLCPGEGVWLGFQAVDRTSPVEVRVQVPGEAEERLVCPPDHALAGRRSAGGRLPFSEGELTVLAGDPDPARLTIRLVSADEFAGITGVSVSPIDPNSAYGGERLP